MQTPVALKDKVGSYLPSKRGHGNLVDDLYQELATKDSALMQLEKSISNLNVNSQDSTQKLLNFDEKNNQYYDDASFQTKQITDTILRKRLELLIANSLKKYKSNIADEQLLLQKIHAKRTTLTDLHTALKISKTLPIIERYQQQHTPSKKPLNDLLKESDLAIKFADSLLKK